MTILKICLILSCLLPVRATGKPRFDGATFFMKGIYKNCLRCGNKFYNEPAENKKFCSNSCWTSYRKEQGLLTGDKNPAFNAILHNIKCNCGCGINLKSYHERNTGYVALHNPAKKIATSINAKKAIKKTQDILFERYGVRNPSQVKGAMKKRENTWIKKYGVNNIGALVPKKATSIELKIHSLLISMGMSPLPQYKIYGWTIDFAFPENKIAIECDGDYWHSKSNVIERDNRKDSDLLNNGWSVLRLSESLINSDIEKCKYKILALW